MSLNNKGFINKIFDYSKLSELLPLETPLSILIDPSNICNFQCIFCPTGDKKLLKSINRPKGLMSYELFCKIIDDIQGFPQQVGSLTLYKDGEPFVNNDLGKMIKYAKSKNVAEVLRTTTNASLLTKAKSIEIIESGLDQIRISVEHVNNEGYKKITRTYAGYETVRKNIEFLYNEKVKRSSNLRIFVKIIDINLTEEEKEKFINDFGAISDEYNFDKYVDWANSEKDELIKDKVTETSMNGKLKINKSLKVCPDPFRLLAVNFNGTVSVCAIDWSLNANIGDVTKENLVDIWNGDKLRKIRYLNLIGDREKIKSCENCHFVLGNNTDLDANIDKLMKKYNFCDSATKLC